MVLLVGKVSATDGRLWYQFGKLRTKKRRLMLQRRHCVRLSMNDSNILGLSHLLRVIQLFAVLPKLSGLDVVMASKSTS